MNDRRALSRLEADTAVALVYPVALGAVGDLTGLAVGVLAVVAVAYLDAPFGFAVAQFGLLPVSATTATSVLVGLEVLFVHVLVVGVLSGEAITRARLMKWYVGIVTLLSVGVAAIHLGPWGRSLLAIGIVGSLAMLLYGTHRYELVTLGRVTEPTDE